jgi:hypothetical protein
VCRRTGSLMCAGHEVECRARRRITARSTIRSSAAREWTSRPRWCSRQKGRFRVIRAGRRTGAHVAPEPDPAAEGQPRFADSTAGDERHARDRRARGDEATRWWQRAGEQRPRPRGRAIALAVPAQRAVPSPSKPISRRGVAWSRTVARRIANSPARGHRCRAHIVQPRRGRMCDIVARSSSKAGGCWTGRVAVKVPLAGTRACRSS